jgi:hypothetical protein
MADHSTAATLKSVRTLVLDQLSSHNAILEADRDADWQTTLDDLTDKFDNITDSIITITRPAAAPALAPEPRTNTIRLEVPKLDAADPHGDWHTFKPQILAMLAQSNCNVNGPVTATQEATIFSMLMQAVKDAGQKFLVTHDNPNSLGTKGWKNLCDNFDNTSRATVTMVLNEFTTNKRESTDTDFAAWLSKEMALHDRISNMEGITLEDALMAIMVGHLPSTPDYANFKNTLLDKDKLTKTEFYTLCTTFNRNEQCRAAAQQRTATPTAPVAMVAQQPVAMVAQQPVAMAGHQTYEPNTGRSDIPGNFRDRQQQQYRGRQQLQHGLRPECNRCLGSHPTSECIRTRNYSCSHCGAQHFERACPALRNQNRNAGNNNNNNNRQAMVRTGGPWQAFDAQRHQGQTHSTQPHQQHLHDQSPQQGDPGQHVQQPQRPDGAGTGWGRTNF